MVEARVTRDEVSFINGITQAYSRDCIFYRCDRPADVSLLGRHEYPQFPHDKHPWIEALISGMMQFHDPERRAEEIAWIKMATSPRLIPRILRVNHAGEHGAVAIYAAQLAHARQHHPDLVPWLEETLSHEERQRAHFREACRHALKPSPSFGRERVG